jgi:recombination protein RecA
MEEGVGKAIVGRKAQLQTNFFESAVGRAHRGEVAMFNTQQMRTKMKPGMPVMEDTASCNSVRHNTSVRMKVARKGDNPGTGLKGDETYVGISQETIVKIVKNKVGPPFRQALYTVEYGKGVLYWDDLLDSCVVHGVGNVVAGGKFSIIDDNGVILGKFWRKGVEEFFTENPEVGVMLVDKLSNAVGIHLWDPIRMTEGGTRRIGPYTTEELDAIGGTVVGTINFEESAEEDIDIAL